MKDKILEILWEYQHDMSFGNRAITIDKFDEIADKIVKLLRCPPKNNSDKH
jgi:hypothetical protein